MGKIENFWQENEILIPYNIGDDFCCCIRCAVINEQKTNFMLYSKRIIRPIFQNMYFLKVL